MKELVIGYDLSKQDYPSVVIGVRIDDQLYIIDHITDGEGVRRFPMVEESENERG